MHKNQFGLRGAVLAAALVAASATASAANFTASFNFDNVASGSAADTALGSFASIIRFGNADTVADVDAFGDPTGAFHWVDVTATYGDVLARNDGTAVSAANVLWNDHQPILVTFSAPQTIAAFSIRQDMSPYGYPGGSYMAFLDTSGHEIAGAQFSYTQYQNPGLTIQSTGTWANVGAVLLPGGKSYDDMSVTAVPEPENWAMLAVGLLLMGAVARRRGG